MLPEFAPIVSVVRRTAAATAAVVLSSFMLNGLVARVGAKSGTCVIGLGSDFQAAREAQRGRVPRFVGCNENRSGITFVRLSEPHSPLRELFVVSFS